MWYAIPKWYEIPGILIRSWLKPTRIATTYCSKCGRPM